MDLMVVTGEASGDAHAADVVAALRRRGGDLRVFGMGGPALAKQGVELVHGAHEISVMGFTEVLPRLPRILAVMNDLVREAAKRRPKVALLVDIPDFNLRLAARLKRLGVQVVWFVSPMVWAWRPGRVRTIARRVDRMLCILPFEEAFYEGTGVSARYVGHPTLDQVAAAAPAADFRRALGLDPAREVLALLPGSRPGEVRRILPAVAAAGAALARERPGLQLVVPRAPGLDRALLEGPLAAAGAQATVVDGRASEVVGASDVAVVASGTATLEAALMERPLVVVYRVSALNAVIGRRVLKVRWVSLPNLLVERGVVPELLQEHCTPGAIAAAVRPLFSGPERERLLDGLREMRARLGPAGAGERAADEVWARLTGGS